MRKREKKGGLEWREDRKKGEKGEKRSERGGRVAGNK